MESINIRVGGEAGQGIATVAKIISELVIQKGYSIFSSKEYMSQIKSGHNFHNIRISNQQVSADVNKINILVAINKESIIKHHQQVNEKGIVLYDSSINIDDIIPKQNVNYIPINVKEIENEIKGKNLNNIIYIGSIIKLFNIPLSELIEILENKFKNKPEIKSALIKAAELSYNHFNVLTEIKLPEIKEEKQLIKLFNGNEIIAKAAIDSGLTFHCQYPMTPVTGILHSLSREATKNDNLTVIQPEDEIAAINFALGASFAGARSMTASSGGGFALMTESISLAGMAEIPLVIIEGQRPGPATGSPTKTEQGDLNFVLNAGHGDFPRIIIAPGCIKEAYLETKRAFHLAEKYQLPVIILIDKHLAESIKSIKFSEKDYNFLKEELSIKRGIINETEIKQNQLNKNNLFKRYKFNSDSYLRSIPGNENGIFTCTGDDHDETGCITENPKCRLEGIERREKKLKQILEELDKPKLIGPENADLTVVSWGSNKGAILEAVENINNKTDSEQNKKINVLMVKNMFPFKIEEITKILNSSNKLVLIENNQSSQLNQLIKKETCIDIKDKILRFDGKTFTVDNVYDELIKRIN